MARGKQGVDDATEKPRASPPPPGDRIRCGRGDRHRGDRARREQRERAAARAADADAVRDGNCDPDRGTVPDRRGDDPVRRLRDRDVRRGAGAAQRARERAHLHRGARHDHRHDQALPGDDQDREGRHRPVPATEPGAQHGQRDGDAHAQSFLRRDPVPARGVGLRHPGRRPGMHRQRPGRTGDPVGNLR
jgi:hypothetical protein